MTDKNALPAELRARILAQAAAEPSLTRAAVRKQALIAALVVLIGISAVFAALGGVTFGARTSSFLLVLVLCWAQLALVFSWAALRRGVGGLGAPTAVLAAGALLIAPVLGVLYTFLHAAYPSAAPPGLLGLFVDSSAGVPLRAHTVCFALTALFAAGLFGVVIALRRGTDPVHPRAFGALAAAACAAWAGLVVTLHCPIALDTHVLLAHVLPALFLAVVGAALGARVFGVRS